MTPAPPGFNPLRVVATIAIAAVVMAALATLVYRDFIAHLPEIGTARPLDEEDFAPVLPPSTPSQERP